MMKFSLVSFMIYFLKNRGLKLTYCTFPFKRLFKIFLFHLLPFQKQIMTEKVINTIYIIESIQCCTFLFPEYQLSTLITIMNTFTDVYTSQFNDILPDFSMLNSCPCKKMKIRKNTSKCKFCKIICKSI